MMEVLRNIRLPWALNVFVAALVGMLAVSLYQGKLATREARADVERLQAELRSLTESVNARQTEVEHLERPERIRQVAEDKLQMQSVKPEQYATVDALKARLGEVQNGTGQ